MAFSHMPVFGHGAVRLPRHCRLLNISLFSAEQMRVTNCTFVDNVAGVTVTGTASFRNVTISRTRAFAGGKYCCGADANFMPFHVKCLPHLLYVYRRQSYLTLPLACAK